MMHKMESLCIGCAGGFFMICRREVLGIAAVAFGLGLLLSTLLQSCFLLILLGLGAIALGVLLIHQS